MVCRVRQVGVLSHTLFAVYVDDFIERLDDSMFFPAYGDDGGKVRQDAGVSADDDDGGKVRQDAGVSADCDDGGKSRQDAGVTDVSEVRF